LRIPASAPEIVPDIVMSALLIGATEGVQRLVFGRLAIRCRRRM
jgi:hypothetical protein